MKTFYLVLLFFVFTKINAQVQRPNYPSNREPLLKTVFLKLPLGAVKPKGWLYDQLVVQANGLTGHLNTVWDIAHTSAWKGDAEANVLPECCTPRYVPRWLEGLVPLAYQLDDERLKGLANQYMGYLLTMQDPAKVSSSLVGWSHVGRVLQGYHEATGDERAIKLGRRILEYSDEIKDVNVKADLSTSRLGMLLGFGWWVYNKTDDKKYISIVDDRTRNNVAEWKNYFIHFNDRTAEPAYLDKPKEWGLHGVDVTQAIQYPISYYLLSKDETDKNSVFRGMENLDRYDGQVNGRWNADEQLAGLKPTQGTELCDITELVYSLTKDFEAIGTVALADRMERLVFNAMPGTCSADFWSHQYDQQANQVLVSDDTTRLWHRNRSTSNIFGFTPNFPCCLSNMHSTFPRYIENMWMATNDNGLVAAAYGPCQVNAKAGNNVDVTITEETTYPFSDVIVFKVKVKQPTNFPLYFRIPEWAEKAVLNVGRKTQQTTKGTVCKVERVWKTGDVVTLKLNNTLRTEMHFNHSASVAWGSLDFVLKIGQSFKQIKIKRDKFLETSRPTGVADWQIEPTTPWNYGLVIDQQNPSYSIEYKKISKIPFARQGEPIFLPGAKDFVSWKEDVPMVLKMKARKVDNWTMKGGNSGDVPLKPVTSTADTTVELIPYGCTRLRISEFPVISLPEK